MAPKTKQMLTRRQFLIGGAAGVGTLAASRISLAHLLPGMARPPVEPPPRLNPHFVQTTCMQCMNQCGVVARIEKGVAVKLDGNLAHPTNLGRMCAKGQAGIQKLYDPQRLIHPLRRVGERGRGEWEIISWDEALDEVTTRLQAAREQSGAKSVVYLENMDYDAVDLARRFCYAFGSPNFIESGANCTSSYYIGLGTALGPHAVRADIANARHILLFGVNPMGIFDMVKGVRNLRTALDAGQSWL
ncbi:MAG: molybdopterin-dependent oxidoreductase [Chloroflexi bacterium]|nr:molybdopterin-dependent oxidoreductase [Chloroflexota bacterium]